MKKNLFFAALFLYNLTLITLYATKSVNPSIASINQSVNQSINQSIITQSINQSFNASIHPIILGQDTNIPKNALKIYPEILNFFQPGPQPELDI